MSCDVSAIVAGGLDAEACLDRIRALELRWSRFIATSEISEINRNPGRATPVSRETIRLVEEMIRGWRVTDGAFDPTLVGALVALGYAESRDDPASVTRLPPTTALKGSPEKIVVDRTGFTVAVPVGTGIEPGGIGKGLAADLVCEEMLEAGATGVLVEIGGDLRAAGAAPVGDAWTISLGDQRASPERCIRLAGGGVATSTTRRRRWHGGSGQRHHLVDPHTLDSCSTPVVTCTVVAGTAAWAEVFTKIAFVVDIDEAVDRYDRQGLAALLRLDDGSEVATAAWKDFER